MGSDRSVGEEGKALTVACGPSPSLHLRVSGPADSLVNRGHPIQFCDSQSGVSALPQWFILLGLRMKHPETCGIILKCHFHWQF